MDQGLINSYLHTFISPVTGRFQLPEDYVFIGDDNGIATPSTKLIDLELDIIGLREDYNLHRSASFVIGFPNTEVPEGQVLSEMDDGFLYSTKGIVSTSNSFAPESITLPEGQVLIGNSEDKAVPSQTITISNLPNLTYQKIWRGNPVNRPVESDDLTNAESNIGSLLSDVADLFSLVNSLQSLVNNLQSAVDGIGGAAGLLALQLQVLGLIAGLAALQSQVDGLTVTLEGEVVGTGSIYDPIQTELILTLDKIKLPVDNVNLNNHKIVNLKSEQVFQLDGINSNFIWDLMHDDVEAIWTP